ncbi:MAG: anion permease, partial [Peptococcaceae bacterium]|nr:anion permease [Peptococcaceae bacterium]
AKALLIGIPFAALIGGVGTPVGSSLNVQALELLQETAGISVSFAKWAALGVPVALILTVLAWLILVFVYKPEIDKLRGLEDIDKELRELGPVSVNEKKWIVVMIILIAVWLSESVHHLPIPATTTLGAAVFFLPGFGFLDWKTQKIDWDVLLLIGAATSLGTTFYQSGAAGWLANLALGGIQGASPLVALIVVIVFTLVIHLLVPVNPAIISIMVPTLVVFSNAAGINQLTLMVPMVFTASAAFLLPLDPVPLLTYGSGHYTMGEFFKAGWILSIAWAAVLLILMLILGGPLGML